jgi:transaldolase
MELPMSDWIVIDYSLPLLPLIALAGCDLLTVRPEILAHIATKDSEVPRALNPFDPVDPVSEKLSYDEPEFRLALNNDVMAYEKLGEGIRAFAADSVKLEGLVSAVA